MPTYKEEYRKRVEGVYGEGHKGLDWFLSELSDFDFDLARKDIQAEVLGATSDTLQIAVVADWYFGVSSDEEMIERLTALEPFGSEAIAKKIGAPDDGLESYADWLTLGITGIPAIIKKVIKKPIRNIIEKKSRGTLVTTGDKSYDEYTKEVVQDPEVQKALRSLTPKKGDPDTIETAAGTLYKTGVPKGKKNITSIPENKLILEQANKRVLNDKGYQFTKAKRKQEFDQGVKKHWEGDKEKFYEGVESEDDLARQGTSPKAIWNVLEKMGIHTEEQLGVTKKAIQKESKRKHLKVVPSKKNDIPVVFQKSTHRRGGKPDGDPVMAYFDHKANKIIIDPELALQKYNEKAWLKPKVPGVKPLPKDSFDTYKDWERFLVEHEQAHTRLPRLKDEAYPDYENRMNDEAFKVIGKRNKYKKKI